MRITTDSIDAYLDHLRLERRLSPRTVEAYRSDLSQHIATLERSGCRSFSRVDTERLRSDLARLHEEGKGRRSQQRYRSSLRGFYRYLQTQGWIDVNPATELEGPKVGRTLPRSLSIREIERLLDAIDGCGPLDLRDRAMIEVAYGTGVRVSELVGLGAEAIDLESRWVRVYGKGDRERVVPLGRAACAAVERYLRESRSALARGRTTSRLFLNRRGQPISRMGFFRILRRRGAAAGFDPHRLHPHLLRHSFATHLLQAGASLRIVQELLGHRSLTTTEIYTAVDRSYLQRIHRRHHPRGGSKKGGGV